MAVDEEEDEDGEDQIEGGRNRNPLARNQKLRRVIFLLMGAITFLTMGSTFPSADQVCKEDGLLSKCPERALSLYRQLLATALLVPLIGISSLGLAALFCPLLKGCSKKGGSSSLRLLLLLLLLLFLDGPLLYLVATVLWIVHFLLVTSEASAYWSEVTRSFFAALFVGALLQTIGLLFAVAQQVLESFGGGADGGGRSGHGHGRRRHH
ncbi:hypothetical protein TYRP_023624 [Tyrophagus putrescentiae]|nr:hypothetical protein TYRP_023624 [Tyrophagus putrescentiae]